ncbi:hypothetical protein [Tateyamaria sp. SN3-11]|uniref:hypothetical protein n=1 Tax=Tateyamaria sp. SN3-11 TaxID=3092147 RepID=UPI0039E7B593
MGYKISNLANLPENLGDFHAFIIGEGTGPQLDWMRGNFDRLAQEIGPDAIVVQGHDQTLTEDILALLKRYSNEQTTAFLDEGLFLFVSEGHPLTTMKPVFVFPLTQADEHSDDAVGYMAAIVDRVIGAIRSDEFSDLVAEKSPDSYSMHYGGGLFFQFLTRLNETLELKPNIIGLGVNFNEIIQAKLESYKRVIG